MPNNNTENLQQTSALDLVGRTELVSNLINKLRDNYFVSVNGPVGSGKSTLVKNLLTQELFNNTALDGRAGNDWRVVYTCPGVNPIGNLAADIRKASGNLAEDDSGKERGIFQEGTLSPEDQDLALEQFRTNGSILTQLYKKALTKIQHPFNLLLIVDQAHDLFRYQRFWSSNAANKTSLEPILGDDVAFINLLLNAKRSIAPIYIILVSDTNYAGNFAPYRGLPEAMNNSSFYVPHLMDAELDYFLDTLIPNKEEDLKESELKRKLKEEFIDISRTKDVSPLLEMNLFFHLLEQKKQKSPEYSPVQLAEEVILNPNPENPTYLQGVITYYIEEYLGQKKLSKSVQYLLQALTGVVGANQLVRNPVTMETLEKLQDRKALLKKVSPPTNSLSIDKRILGLIPGKKAPKPQDDPVSEVIEKPLNTQQIFDELSKFNVGGRKLILLPEPHELSKASIVDFNYDVLLSSWPKLKNLIKEEWEYAQVFRNFVRDAIFHYTNPAQPGTNLGKGLPVAAFTSLKKWIDYCKPNEAWAERYLPTPPSNEDLKRLKQHPAFEGQPDQKLTNWFIANKYYTEVEDYFENLEQQKERQKERTENQRTLAVILGSISAILCIFAFVSLKVAKHKSQIIAAREFLNVLSYNEVLNIPNDMYKSFDTISVLREEVDKGKRIKSDKNLLEYLLEQKKISIGSKRDEVKNLSFDALVILKELYKKNNETEEQTLLEKFQMLTNIEGVNSKAFRQTQYPAFYHTFNAYYWEKKLYDTIPKTFIDPGALATHADGKRYSFGDKNGQVHLVSTNTEYLTDRRPDCSPQFTRLIKPIKSVSFGRKDTMYIGNELGGIYRYPGLNTRGNLAQKEPELIFTDDNKKTIHFLKSWPGNPDYLLVSNTFQVYFLHREADGKFRHLTADRASVTPLPDSRIATRTWDPDSKLFLIGCRDSVLIYQLDPFAKKNIKKICCITNYQSGTPITFTSVAIKKKGHNGSNSFYLALGDETGNVWIGELSIGKKGTESVDQDLEAFRKFKNVHTSTVTCMAFNPDALQLASASFDGGLKFWNLNTLKEEKDYDDVFLRYNSGVQAIAYLNKDELVVYYDLYHFVEPTNVRFMYNYLKNN